VTASAFACAKFSEHPKRGPLIDCPVHQRAEDLRIPPANRLEPLRANRAGQHSIPVNDQYRLCFTWTDAGPADVELCDYH